MAYNFVFVCDTCLTKREIQETATCDNKLHDIQAKVSGLENGLKKIVTLLQSNNDGNLAPAILSEIVPA